MGFIQLALQPAGQSSACDRGATYLDLEDHVGRAPDVFLRGGLPAD